MSTTDALLLPDAKPSAKTPGPSTGQITAALIAHYRKPDEARSGEVLITEAESPAGQRRCDLIRVGMWASRGTGIDGHEVKVSRADWLRELDDPAKAEAWWPYCSRWWAVTPPGVVAPGELPAGWGLMELPRTGRRFKVIVQAPAKEPKLTVRLLVELLRRADNGRLAEMDQLRAQHGRDLTAQAGKLMRERAVVTLPADVRARLEVLERVEVALGVPLDTFGGWPRLPVTKVTPAELAAYLSDTLAHVTVQRRAGDAAHLRDKLLAEARRVVTHLEQAAGETA